MAESTQHLTPSATQGTPAPRQGSWIKTAMMVTGLAVAMLATNAIAAWPRNPVAALVIGPILATAMICLYLWTGRRVERRKVEEFPSHHGVRHLLLGMGIGVLMSGATVGILALFGAYTITGWGSIAGMLAVAGMMCAIAVSEEVFFRGVVFRLLRGRWGTGLALAVSAIIFGLVHLVNPDASLWGAFAIMIEAGIMLGAAFLATGSLWLAVGVHFGWNFATTGLFGSVTSGSEARDSLVTAVTSGPDWLTGGSFGPEASIIAILVCSIATVLFLAMARRRGRLALRRR
ncbi:lysostaphin resistance A-like protein [Glutamicibacter arilaitensis]|uniref:CPBP family intramembrane glutamic endopeptidase n=1 Tax=Glutamicibacter arilaitensis TaxID=256701 RepID=UPI00384A4874